MNDEDDYEVIGIPYQGVAGSDGAVAIAGLDWSFPVAVSIAHIAIRNDGGGGGSDSTISITLNGQQTAPAPFSGEIDIDVGGLGVSGELFVLAIDMTGFPPQRQVGGTASVFFQASPPEPAGAAEPEPTIIAIPYDWNADADGVFTLKNREWAVPVDVAIQAIEINNLSPCRPCDHEVTVELQIDVCEQPGPGQSDAKKPPLLRKANFKGCDSVTFALRDAGFAGTKFCLDMRMTGFQQNERVSGCADVYLLRPRAMKPAVAK